MPKLPQLSAAELEYALRSMGFEKVGQRGSHIKLRDATGRTAIVPNHKHLKPGTLKKGILNPLGISVEELIAHLRR